MNNLSILHATEKYVRELSMGESTGHDWWHIHRVRNLALKLSQEENADDFVVELASLLHDVADHKFHDGNEDIGPKTAQEFLTSLAVDDEVIEHVVDIIRGISYKGAGVDTPMKTIEGKVVQDADRLDAMGAIGIARAFAYGGYKGREIYNPEIKPELHQTFKHYKKSTGPSINHFYEKLFLLKDRMNTATASKIAIKRHQVMRVFVEQFMEEWKGGD